VLVITPRRTSTEQPTVELPSVTAVTTTLMPSRRWPRLVSRRTMIRGSAAALVGGLSLTWLAGSGRTRQQSLSPGGEALARLRAGGSIWRVQEGAWQVDGDALIGSGGQVISETELGDGTLEIHFEFIDPTGTHSVGIGFRAQDIPEREDGSGYGVNFRLGSATFNLFKGTCGSWAPVDPAFPAYHASPVVRPRENQVTVRASGGSFVILVNDKEIAAFTDDAYIRGRITLWVESAKERVRFSRIRMG
jgi:hypothetical protein